MQEENNQFFPFEINPSLGLLDQESFLKKFQQDLSDENQWPKFIQQWSNG